VRIGSIEDVIGSPYDKEVKRANSELSYKEARIKNEAF